MTLRNTMHIHTNLYIILLLPACFHPVSAGYSTNQFQNWYPELRFVFSHILTNNCSDLYDVYLTAQKHNIAPDNPKRYTGLEPSNQLAQPVVNCILESTSPFIMAEMGSAQVLLGLAPAILATLGPSSEEISILSVIARRPLPAFLLAVGSPAVFAIRSFENTDPLRLLTAHEGFSHPPKLSWGAEITVMIVKYILALAAIANVITLGYELGVQVVCSFAPQLTYIPLLSGFLSLSVHISGIIALHLRTNVHNKGGRDSFLEWAQRQLTPLARQQKVYLSIVPETYSFILLSWFTSLLSACHVICGTLTFSSMLFISVRDSLTVISRFMASVLACRAILMYELAVLRQSLNTGTTTDAEETEL